MSNNIRFVLIPKLKKWENGNVTISQITTTPNICLEINDMILKLNHTYIEWYFRNKVKNE